MFFLVYVLALLTSYAFMGGAIKLLDNISDYPSQYRTRLPWVLTLSLATIVNIWILLDAFTAILAFALIIGLLAARKVDNIYFICLALATIPLCLLRIFQLNVLPVSLLTLLVLVPSIIVDEILHSIANKPSQPYLRWLLFHRPLVKIIVFVLPLFGLFTVIHAVAFWCFDLTYEIVAYHYRAPSASKHYNAQSPIQ